jgi:hypothetical protein
VQGGGSYSAHLTECRRLARSSSLISVPSRDAHTHTHQTRAIKAIFKTVSRVFAHTHETAEISPAFARHPIIKDGEVEEGFITLGSGVLSVCFLQLSSAFQNENISKTALVKFNHRCAYGAYSILGPCKIY